MGFPAAVPTGVMQERVARPAISTVQAPHWPSPHPYLQPVRSRSSRRTLSRLRSASADTDRFEPFTWSSLIVAIAPPQPDVIGGIIGVNPGGAALSRRTR